MPSNQVITNNSVLKIYKHETNRKIRAIDLNTISGVSLPGSQLEILIHILKGITGKWSGDIIVGMTDPVIQTDKISANSAVIITNSGVYYLDRLILTPSLEAHYGHYELELFSSDSDHVSLDFFNPITKTFENRPSATRKEFIVKIWEVYSTSPVSQPTTAGRIRWIEYRKAASNNPEITHVKQTINPDWNMDAIKAEIANRYTIHDTDIRLAYKSDVTHTHNSLVVTVPPPGILTESVSIKRTGNYLYWDVGDGGGWRPFA